MVKTAGDHRTITKDADLITQTVAKYMSAVILGIQIRPVEFVTMLQIDPICDSDAVAFLMPRFREIASQCIRDGLV